MVSDDAVPVEGLDTVIVNHAEFQPCGGGGGGGGGEKDDGGSSSFGGGGVRFVGYGGMVTPEVALQQVLTAEGTGLRPVRGWRLRRCLIGSRRRLHPVGIFFHEHMFVAVVLVIRNNSHRSHITCHPLTCKCSSIQRFLLRISIVFHTKLGNHAHISQANDPAGSQPLYKQRCILNTHHLLILFCRIQVSFFEFASYRS